MALIIPPMLFAILSIFMGLALLIVGGDKLVDGAADLARRFKLTELFIGIAIVGFGTSLPEVMATMSAMRAGSPDIALGNILGSNIANIGLILGVALWLATSASGMRAYMKDYIMMLLALVLFTGFMVFNGGLNFTAGVVLLGGLLGYLGVSLWFSRGIERAKQTSNPENMKNLPKKSLFDPIFVKSILFIIGGLIALVIGAEWLISGATYMAHEIGISERIIGLTLIAIGSSLPELAAAIAAARQGKLALTTGNILGSNAFNVLAAGGLSALIAPLPNTQFSVDIVAMFVMALIIFPLFILKRRPYKLLGTILLASYAGYMYIFVM